VPERWLPYQNDRGRHELEQPGGNAEADGCHQEPEAAKNRVEMGVPSPIGVLAIGLSSEAAQRSLRRPAAILEPPESPGFDVSTSVRLSDILRFTASFATDDKAVERPTSKHWAYP
jgi:hypothetical protein